MAEQHPLEINYCLQNIDPATRALLRTCGHSVIEDVCLQRCGRCYDGPYLVVNGAVVTGESHQEILEKIDASTSTDDKDET